MSIRLLCGMLIIGLLCSCRTRDYSPYQTPYEFDLVSLAQVRSLVMLSALETEWSFVTEDVQCIRVQRRDNRWALLLDVHYSCNQFWFEVINDNGLRLDKDKMSIHKLGYKWMADLRSSLIKKINEAATFARSAPYKSQRHVISLEQGRSLHDVIIAACHDSKLDIVSESEGLIACKIDDDGYMLEIVYDNVSYKITQYSSKGVMSKRDVYYHLIRHLELYIAHYANPTLLERRLQREQQHQDNVEQQRQLRGLRRAVIWGF